MKRRLLCAILLLCAACFHPEDDEELPHVAVEPSSFFPSDHA